MYLIKKNIVEDNGDRVNVVMSEITELKHYIVLFRTYILLIIMLNFYFYLSRCISKIKEQILHKG